MRNAPNQANVESKPVFITYAHAQSWLNFDLFIWSLNASGRWWGMLKTLKDTCSSPNWLKITKV